MTAPKIKASRVAIALSSDDEYRAAAGLSFDSDKTLHVMKMLAGTDDMFAATTGLIKAVFSAEGVDAKLRQMIILRTAKVLDVSYEWQANVTLSRNNRLTAAEIVAAARDGAVAGVDADYALVSRAVDEVSLRQR